jgi:hypothetical protein
MKNALLVFSILLVSGCGNHHQESKEVTVPAAVQDAFSKQFPNAGNVKWSMESENEYEAEYELDKNNQASNYDVSGKWLVTETEISKSNLPDSVKSTLTKEFEGYKIIKAEKVENPVKGISYEVKFEKGEFTFVAEFSSEGKVLNSKKANEKEDEQGEEDEEGDEEGKG